MIYAMSDLHGCYDKYAKMLQMIKFNQNDTLFILGDIADRGDGGIEIYKDIMKRPNVVHLRGNHDNSALVHLGNAINYPIATLGEKCWSPSLDTWLCDGGEITMKKFKEEPRETQIAILEHISSTSYGKRVEVNGRKFILSHTIPEIERYRFHIHEMTGEMLTWGEPDFEKKYLLDCYNVIGHTPTSFIDPKYRGRIWSGKNKIAIDCGAVFGNPLGCLCLDNLKAYYAR